MDRNLIFDLGFHNGSDARFYLGKGFRVIALEANPDLAEKGAQDFQKEVASGQLTIVNRAISAQAGAGPVAFFVNDEKDDWSSTRKDWAEKGGHAARQIMVESITLDGMTEEFGHPYYVKCDIEGEDRTFIDQVAQAGRKPRFLSVEGGGPYYLRRLTDAGYTKFQIVNQILHFTKRCPEPSREGKYFQTRFTNVMSGLFGEELPQDRWWSAEKTNDVLEKFKQLRAIDREMAPGWVDLHAMRED